jgi:hypothetical protein
MRDPTGKNRIPPPREDAELEAESQDGRVRLHASLPPRFAARSRLAWPFLMLIFGGVGGAGGTFGYHRAIGPDGHGQPSPALMQRLDDALERVQKLEETTHNLELSNERNGARLDAIRDDLTDIKALLRRGR